MYDFKFELPHEKFIKNLHGFQAITSNIEFIVTSIL